MRKLPLAFLLAFVFAPFVSHTPLASTAADSSGQLNLPWEEMRKLLHVGTGEIHLEMEDFIKLLRQTEARKLPPFATKEGLIILSREEFRKLLDAMRPPADGESPGTFLITRAEYNASVEEDTTRVRADFAVEILAAKGLPEFVTVPLLRRDLAVSEAQVNGRPAVLARQGGDHAVVLKEAGRHNVRVVFHAATDLKRGPQSVTIPVPETPITLLSAALPFVSIKPEIADAKAIRFSSDRNETRLEAVLSPTRQIQIGWSRLIEEEKKGPPKVYADVNTLLSLEDAALRVNTTAEINVLNNTIGEIPIDIPAGYQVLSLTGSDIADWREREDGQRRFLNVSLKAPKQGSFAISIRAEKLLPDATAVADFSGFRFPDTVREKGYLGVELRSGAEARVVESSGLDRVAFGELPTGLLRAGTKPLVFAFKYLRHPYSLVMDVEKHEELDVVGTVVDEASAMTLFTSDGKRVHRVTFSVRNTWKQFMEIALPQGAQLWSAFVGGEPVKPSRNAEGKTLIPLNRSREEGTGLAAFDVEVIFFEKERSFGWFGRRAETFPVPDVMMSRILWSFYLPVNYRFLHFGGSMEKEKIASGISPVFGVSKRVIDLSKTAGTSPAQLGAEQPAIAGDLRSGFRKGVVVDSDQLRRQIDNELTFNARLSEVQRMKPTTGGILPIRIEIPAVGQLYRFADQIVTEEIPDVTFTFVNEGLASFIGLLILALCAWLLYRYRRKLYPYVGILSGVWGRTAPHARRFFEPGILAASMWALFLITLLLASSHVSARFRLVALILAVAASARYAVVRWKAWRPQRGETESKE